MPKGTCSVEGCDGQSLTRGWCSAHYQKWKTYGDPQAGRQVPRNGRNACAYDGCSNNVKAFGWCSTHWRRIQHHGTPELLPRPSVEDRLRAQLEYSEECWEWRGKLMSSGYGTISVNKRHWGTHRLAYTLWVGPIPDGLLVCHHCDNKVCCNPAHLFVGTHQDNNADMRAKGRQNPAPRWARGDQSPHSTLTETAVRFIRESGLSHSELGRMFGVSHSAIRNVRIGATWKHLL